MASSTNPSIDAISIRLAEANDAAIIRDLLADLVRTLKDGETCGSSLEDILRHGFRDPPRFEALIAEADGSAVGMTLFFYNYSTWRGCLGVYVQDLHVIDDFRGRGLGRKLLAAAAQRGREFGCNHLRLSVDPDNTLAAAFYRHVGLEVRKDEAICQVSEAAFERLAGEAP